MPEHFNNNGDQGNIEALSLELKAAKVEHAAIDKIEEADFVLFGDAGRAAMSHYAHEPAGNHCDMR